MARYIDVENLINDLQNPELFNVSKRIIDIINEQPTADVTKVVGCKDCKYHLRQQEPEHGRTEHFCSQLGIKVDRYFYCARGVRMDGEKNNV